MILAIYSNCWSSVCELFLSYTEMGALFFTEAGLMGEGATDADAAAASFLCFPTIA